jgi:hypothetical protein
MILNRFSFSTLQGIYGDVKTLGAGNAFLIIVQLFFAGVIVIILVKKNKTCFCKKFKKLILSLIRTSCCKKDMVSVLVFRCLLRPTSARTLSGRRCRQRRSTLVVVPNSKVAFSI